MSLNAAQLPKYFTFPHLDLFPLWSKYIWFVYYELNNQWLKQTQKDLNRLSLSASFSFNAVNVFFIFCQSWILLSDEQILLLCTSLSFISSLCIKRFPGYIMQMIWGGRRHFDLTLFHVIDTNRQSIWQSSWSSYGICTRRTSLVWGGVDAENPTPVSPYYVCKVEVKYITISWILNLEWKSSIF